VRILDRGLERAYGNPPFFTKQRVPHIKREHVEAFILDLLVHPHKVTGTSLAWDSFQQVQITTAVLQMGTGGRGDQVFSHGKDESHYYS
jgi:hypothetical protein